MKRVIFILLLAPQLLFSEPLEVFRDADYIVDFNKDYQKVCFVVGVLSLCSTVGCAIATGVSYYDRVYGVMAVESRFFVNLNLTAVFYMISITNITIAIATRG